MRRGLTIIMDCQWCQSMAEGSHTLSLNLVHEYSVVPLPHAVYWLSVYCELDLTHSLSLSLIFSQNKSLQYIQQEDPDIFCLQETKCAEDDLPKVLTVCTPVVVTVSTVEHLRSFM